MAASRTTRTTLTAAAAALCCCAAASASAASPAPQEPAAPRPEVKWNLPDRPPIPGVEHGVLRSPSMDRDVGYNVYLPPGYAAATSTRYPVVYFLHGAGGTENSDAGAFAGLLAREIAATRIPPVIAVFPNGGMSGYADRPETKVMGETLITRELIPHIDGKYRTVAAPTGRSVCGFSMGGGGAVRLALKHPDLFSAAASWAGALNPRGGGDPANGPAALAKANYDRLYGKVRFLLIVGDRDLTYPSHPDLLRQFNDLKLPYEFHLLQGVGHDLGAYYDRTGVRLVAFVTEGFAAVPAAKP